MNRKDIFRHTRQFIGGKPTVYAYYNEDNSKSIDIMTSTNTQYEEVDVHSTIGLSETNINNIVAGKRVGVELIAVGDKGQDINCNILASVAFEIMDENNCYFGKIFINAISKYDNSLEMKHVILLAPAYWDRYSQISSNDMIISWLLLIPISEKEKAYIESKGVDAFEKILVRQKADITDINRKSFVL